jgi:hypothetical protein
MTEPGEGCQTIASHPQAAVNVIRAPNAVASTGRLLLSDADTRLLVLAERGHAFRPEDAADGLVTF